jgi:hypothetical protein
MIATQTRRPFVVDLGQGLLIAGEYGRAVPGYAESRALLTLDRGAQPGHLRPGRFLGALHIANHRVKRYQR